MRIGITGKNAAAIIFVGHILLISSYLCHAQISNHYASMIGNGTVAVGFSTTPPLGFRSNGSRTININNQLALNQTKMKPGKSMRGFKGRRRRRRSVVQLAGMLRCVTGCNPLLYKGYGCYCGYMGAGYPMDEIDRCCLEHDWCYSHISCPQFLMYFIPYEWSCLGAGYPQCELGSLAGLPAECALQLCECDRAFARCIRKFPCPKNKLGCLKRTYLPRYRG